MISSPTLAQAIWPQKSATRDLSLVGLAAMSTFVAAQLQIPLQPVPLTMQTFVVMLSGLTLGSRLAASSMCLYLLAGACQLPVYAGFSGGLTHLLGPTGGYLVSFVVVSWVLGWISERGFTKRWLGAAIAIAIGVLLNLGLGTLWLSHFVGPSAAYEKGFVPFVAVEAAKGAIAIPLLPLAWKWVRPGDAR